MLTFRFPFKTKQILLRVMERNALKPAKMASARFSLPGARLIGQDTRARARPLVSLFRRTSHGTRQFVSYTLFPESSSDLIRLQSAQKANQFVP
jgi:hypothetical protein